MFLSLLGTYDCDTTLSVTFYSVCVCVCVNTLTRSHHITDIISSLKQNVCICQLHGHSIPTSFKSYTAGWAAFPGNSYKCCTTIKKNTYVNFCINITLTHTHNLFGLFYILHYTHVMHRCICMYISYGFCCIRCTKGVSYSWLLQV